MLLIPFSEFHLDHFESNARTNIVFITYIEKIGLANSLEKIPNLPKTNNLPKTVKTGKPIKKQRLQTSLRVPIFIIW